MSYSLRERGCVCTWTDTSAQTTNITFYVKNQTSYLVVDPIVGAGANTATFSQTITHTAGETIEYGFYIENDYLGTTSQHEFISFIGEVSLFGTGGVTWVEQWLALGLLFLVAAGFSMASVKLGVIVVPIFAMVETYVFGWLQPAVGLTAMGACLGILLLVGVLIYMRRQSDKVS